MKTNYQYILGCLFLMFLMGNCTHKKIATPKKNTYPNYLKNTKWLIKDYKVVGVDTNEKEYVLSVKNDSAPAWNFSAIEFLDDKTFHSYNSWECGNDCFVTSHGNYFFVKDSIITLQVDSITLEGTCDPPPKDFSERKEITFALRKVGDSLFLNK